MRSAPLRALLVRELMKYIEGLWRITDSTLQRRHAFFDHHAGDGRAGHAQAAGHCASAALIINRVLVTTRASWNLVSTGLRPVPSFA